MDQVVRDELSAAKLGTGNLEILMQRYQESDREAASALIEQMSGPLFRFFLAQARDRERAQDLHQEFWLRIHKARHTYRPGEPVVPWLFAIARRVQVDDYRKRKRVVRREVSDERIESIPAGEPRAEVPSVPELLESLPRSQRNVLVMLKVAGLTIEETARATGTTVGAVKQKAHRAYTKLRRLYEGKT